jgi:hypothetical protein
MSLTDDEDDDSCCHDSKEYTSTTSNSTDVALHDSFQTIPFEGEEAVHRSCSNHKNYLHFHDDEETTRYNQMDSIPYEEEEQNEEDEEAEDSNFPSTCYPPHGPLEQEQRHHRIKMKMIPLEEDPCLFPSLPAFTVKVEIRPTPYLGCNQYGVFASEDIPPNTTFWMWTDRIKSFHYSELEDYIQYTFLNSKEQEMTQMNRSNKLILSAETIEAIRTFLRRGFVLPAPQDHIFHSNVADAGCFMNHSSNPNCGQPHGTLREIHMGEELTMDYSGNGNPQWFVDICHKYGMLTSVEIAERQKELGEDRFAPAEFPIDSMIELEVEEVLIEDKDEHEEGVESEEDHIQDDDDDAVDDNDDVEGNLDIRSPRALAKLLGP